jgi:inorganic pyrophosphatase
MLGDVACDRHNPAAIAWRTGAPGSEPVVEVVIEIPRWSFLKRGSTGQVDFVSPLPCPFNYGCVPDYVGLDGDLLDAVVLGPRLRLGTRIRVTALGAVGLAERGLYDDKLICSASPIGPRQKRRVLAFFHCYALAKRLRNRLMGRRGDGGCTGWLDAPAAIARALPREGAWPGPTVPF